MQEIQQFHRADLGNLPDYVPARVTDFTQVIKLDANENPYGPSPRAIAALANWQAWHFYPPQEELGAALAQYVGLNPENIVVTNGADESIDLLLRAVLEPHKVVIDCPPSFEMYRILTYANPGRAVEVHRRNDFSLNVDAVAETCERTQAKLIMLTSPNNPDGALLPRRDLERLLQLPALVVLDEAYAEFAGESATPLVAQHSNLVIVRTFSKWAGLAGLRVGYLALAPVLAQAIHKVRAPYNVNAAGIVTALASLADKEYLMGNVQTLVNERERMCVALGQLGFLEPLPSRANFLLCKVKGRNACEIKGHLAQRGILIRSYESPRLREYVRISIGTPEQNAAVLNALCELKG